MSFAVQGRLFVAASTFGAEGASGGAPVTRAQGRHGVESADPGQRVRGPRRRERSVQRGPTPQIRGRCFGAEGADDPGHVATASV
jgi:hypothetical protein